jgi:hypothetical protein
MRHEPCLSSRDCGTGRIGHRRSDFARINLAQPESQDRAKQLSQDKNRRQKLYRQFIEEASKLYADVLVHSEAEISALVS